MQRIYQISLVVFMLLAMASCGEKEETKKAPPPAAEYKTMTLQPRQISGNMHLPGVMQPFQFVQLFPRVSGFVRTVNVDRGSVVRKGQVLVVLDAPETEQQVAAAKLKYTQAQAAYVTSKDRYRRMLETSHTPGTISQYDLEAAASKMQGDSAVAQGEYANYRAQEAMKAYLTITAPFDGVITERNVHPGALAGPSMPGAKPMLLLQQVAHLRLVVDIPEQYAPQIKDGDKVHYRVNALPGTDFTGSVARSSQSLGTTYRSETIEIDVQNSDGKFKPGMYAEVTLPTSGSANAFVVPRSAIVSTTERKYVIIAGDDKVAKWVDISEGNQGSDSTEIFGDVRAGSSVITNATYRIKNGEKVN